MSPQLGDGDLQCVKPMAGEKAKKQKTKKGRYKLVVGSDFASFDLHQQQNTTFATELSNGSVQQ